MRPNSTFSAGLILLALPGCQKIAPDGLTTEGALRSVAEWPSGNLKKEQLTDPLALKAALIAVDKGAPPLNHDDPKSYDAREGHVARERERILGKGDHLFALQCGATEGSSGYLAYTPSDKNLRINLYTPPPKSEALSRKAQEALDRLGDALELDQRYAALTEGDTNLSALDFSKSNQALMDELEEVGDEFATLKLPSGLQFRIWNSPFDGLNYALSIAGSSAYGEHQKFVRGAIYGKVSNAFEFSKRIREAKSRFHNLPVNLVDRSFYIKYLPYNGDPGEVCLILRVADVKLTSDSSKEPSLRGKVRAWYLVEKENLQILSQAIPPKDGDD